MGRLDLDQFGPGSLSLNITVRSCRAYRVVHECASLAQHRRNRVGVGPEGSSEVYESLSISSRALIVQYRSSLKPQ